MPFTSVFSVIVTLLIVSEVTRYCASEPAPRRTTVTLVGPLKPRKYNPNPNPSKSSIDCSKLQPRWGWPATAKQIIDEQITEQYSLHQY